jgi:hypothetical protein
MRIVTVIGIPVRRLMRLSVLEPFKQVPFYFWVKDSNGVYLWGSTPMDRFAGGTVIGRTDVDFVPEAESVTTAASLQANDRHVIETGEDLFTHERIEDAGNLSVCKWPGELDGQPVTFGLSFLVPSV